MEIYRDFTYIDDIIEGVTRLIENSPAIFNKTLPYKVYNIGNNKPERLIDLIQAIEHSTGKKAIKKYYPMQAGDVYQTYADIKNLFEDVGFKPNTSIDDGINKFITWYNQYYNQVDMN